MKNILSLLFLPCVAVFTSCQKVIPAKDLPDQEARMVVNCLLYNDSAIKANITLSKSIVSNKKFKTVDNAVCRVLENDIFIGNMTFKDSGHYISNIIPKPNKRYSLYISTPSFSTINATTYVPGTFSVSTAKRYDTLNFKYKENNYGPSYRTFGGECKYKLSVFDTSAAKNYFSISARVELTDSLGNLIPDFSTAYLYNNVNTNGLTGNSYYGGGSYEFDDLTKVNNTEIQLDFTVSFNYTLVYGTKIKSAKVFVYLSSLSEEYYRYKVMLDKQYSTGVSFFAEPVQAYSNVSNKMGIVAGANITGFRIY